MARCHRIGQSRPVVIYKLCTKGTIDETIIKRSASKRVLEKVIISEKWDTNHINPKRLLELKKLLESKEYKIVTSDKEGKISLSRIFESRTKNFCFQRTSELMQ